MEILSPKLSVNTRKAKERYILPFMYFFSSLGLYFAYTYYFRYPSRRLAFICLVTSVLAFLTPLVRRYIHSFPVVANYLITLLFLCIESLTVFTGGLKSSSIWWFGVIPVFAVFILNSFYSLVWFIITIANIFFLIYLKNSDLLPISAIPSGGFDQFILTSTISGISMLTMFCILTDIIRERTSQEKEELLDQTFQLNKLATIGKLAAGVSHEINNPLAVIRATESKIARMIQSNEEIDKAKLQEYMTKIERSISRINNVTSSLRTYSENESPDRIEIIQIESLVVSVVDSLMNKIQKNNVNYFIEEDDPKSYINVSYKDIFQALQNILLNSIDELKHISGERKLKIKIVGQSESVNIYIHDNGRGVADSIRNKIFEPFFTTKSVGEGQGLGLSFAANVIKKNSGTVELTESEFGRGVCFKIEFPLK